MLFSMPHWGIFPILIEIYRSPLVYMIIHGYGYAPGRCLIHFVRILRGASLESFSQIHTLYIVVIPGWSCLWCLDFPRHHFRGVHIRSVTRPIGVILGSSGQIGYI
ncbi:hypothetical protein CK203_037484 [Vitis vinifera]|uniref:Uncharacterized protein n=1 Tax=Vitis vinifera TaxID=29760 RepID=A0A438HMD1_VITVI|nr:hypothetical protein CK203_037484 [Vitis vinifera]